MKSLLSLIEPTLLTENTRHDRALNTIFGKQQADNELPVQTQKKSKWSVLQSPERLVRNFKFDNLKIMKIFLDEMINYQNKVSHHAKMTIENAVVRIETYTHDIDMITELDKELADFSDMLYDDVKHYFQPQPDDDEVADE